MSAEHDIRSALRAEADRYDPADDGWTGIHSGVGAACARRRRRVVGGVLGAVAVSVLALGAATSLSDRDTDVDAGPFSTEPTTATTEATTPRTTETTTPPTSVAPVAEEAVFPGIWPFANQEAVDRYEDGDARFEDPAATAEAFARDYVGMLDPVVQDVRAAAPDSSDVSLDLVPKGEDGKPVPDGGARTTVLLRPYPTSYGVDVWTVISASSDDLVLDEPSRGDEASGGVVRVRGQGTGYEGHVKAEVRQDGMQLGSNLGEEIGITGSMGELGPLSLDVPFTTPSEPGGAVLVTTDTGRDGVGVPEFTVVRVHFAEPSPVPPADPVAPEAGDEPPGRQRCVQIPESADVGDASMVVTIYLICDAAVATNADVSSDGSFLAVTRVVPRSEGVLQASLQALLQGTQPGEAGVLSSVFSADTADVLRSVTIVDGTAIVDLDARLTQVANGASTSFGSPLFLGQLTRTVLQFPTVEAVEYRLDGSCQAFGEWLQSGVCETFPRANG